MKKYKFTQSLFQYKGNNQEITQITVRMINLVLHKLQLNEPFALHDVEINVILPYNHPINYNRTSYNITNIFTPFITHIYISSL